MKSLPCSVPQPFYLAHQKEMNKHFLVTPQGPLCPKDKKTPASTEARAAWRTQMQEGVYLRDCRAVGKVCAETRHKWQHTADGLLYRCSACFCIYLTIQMSKAGQIVTNLKIFKSLSLDLITTSIFYMQNKHTFAFCLCHWLIKVEVSKHCYFTR